MMHRNECETPADLYALIDKEFHPTLDVAATCENAKAATYFTTEDNGLLQDWGIQTCYLFPPETNGKNEDVWTQWLRKAAESAHKRATVITLVEAKTGAAWFYDYARRAVEIRFLVNSVRLDCPVSKDYTSVSNLDAALLIFRPETDPPKQRGLITWWDWKKDIEDKTDDN
jgi:phage N-6-adenine-methyltransferase